MAAQAGMVAAWILVLARPPAGVAEPAQGCEACIDNDVHEVQLVQMPPSLREAGSSDAAQVYGLSGCPCVGTAWEGNLSLAFNGTLSIYPAALGSSCQAWDVGRHPECKADSPPSWCATSWCYVDPCDCDVFSTPDYRAPLASVNGHRVHYSSVTCARPRAEPAADLASLCAEQLDVVQCQDQVQCSWLSDRGCVTAEAAKSCRARDSFVRGKRTGSDACRCIGLAEMLGYVPAFLASQENATPEEVDFPAEVGSFCFAWDSKPHPACRGAGPGRPSWCDRSWCYVDPCACDMDAAPAPGRYFPGATFQGRQLFYSYASCGAVDEYTAAEGGHTCTSHVAEDSCGGARGCVWDPWRGCMSEALWSVCGLALGAVNETRGSATLFKSLNSLAYPTTPCLVLIGAAVVGLLAA
mmetsp:Transcript_156513/g.480154  ORF Transcript_156513/g.480154 Transcript_156513/m.480154 type:complete len:411 (+) Transcript_156513:83-1315(+)